MRMRRIRSITRQAMRGDEMAEHCCYLMLMHRGSGTVGLLNANRCVACAGGSRCATAATSKSKIFPFNNICIAISLTWHRTHPPHPARTPAQQCMPESIKKIYLRAVYCLRIHYKCTRIRPNCMSRVLLCVGCGTEYDRNRLFSKRHAMPYCTNVA